MRAAVADTIPEAQGPPHVTTAHIVLPTKARLVIYPRLLHSRQLSPRVQTSLPLQEAFLTRVKGMRLHMGLTCLWQLDHIRRVLVLPPQQG